MPSFANIVLDSGLSYLTSNANQLRIFAGETLLGTKSSLTVGSVGAGTPDGRKVTVPAITDGSVTVTGNPTIYRLGNWNGSEFTLLVEGNETTSITVNDGNTFTSPSFDIRIPDPASGRFIHSNVQDNGLSYLDDYVSHLYITPSLITSYGSLSGNILGTKANPTISIVSGSPSGRAARVSAITDGTGDTNGTGTHFCLVDETGDVVLAAGPIAASKTINSGEDWALQQFDITFPQP